MELIDKDAVVSEIIELDGLNCLEAPTISHNEDYKCGYSHAIEKVRDFIDTLEVKEVNFKDTKSVFEGQYLSKDKVVTTIERLQDECEKQGDNNGVELLEKLFNKLDTIEVKEVDLEKELNEYFEGWRTNYYSETEELLKNNGCTVDIDDVKEIARHFFELGLKVNNDAVIEKACDWLKNNVNFTHPRTGKTKCVVNLNAFRDAMKGE